MYSLSPFRDVLRDVLSTRELCCLQENSPRINKARSRLRPIGRPVAVPTVREDREGREDLDRFHQDLLCKVTVPLRPAKIRMAGELLDGPHRDTPHREPRAEIVSEIVALFFV